MLTWRDKRFLLVYMVLLIAAIVSYVIDERRVTTANVSYPDGLYILAYDSTPLFEDELPAHVERFSSQTGTGVNFVRATKWDDAILRSVVDKETIDVVMVTFDMREDFRRQGDIIPLHTLLDEFPNPTYETAMRWLWSSIDNKPLCGFLIGERGEPTFACVWDRSEQPRVAAEFIRYLVVNTTVSEERLLQPNHFARKFLVEEDYGPIYDNLLHPSRQAARDRDWFLNFSTSCPDGIIQQIRVVERETNDTRKVDPVTGMTYGKEELMQYGIEYYCVRDGIGRRQMMPLVETLEGDPPHVFIPEVAYIPTWPSP